MKIWLCLLVLLAGCASPAAELDAAPPGWSATNCATLVIETLVWADQLEPYLPAGFYVKAAPAGPAGAEAANQGTLLIMDISCPRGSFSLTGIRVEQTHRGDLETTFQYFIIESAGLGLSSDVRATPRMNNGTTWSSDMDGAHGHDLRVAASAYRTAEKLMVAWDGTTPWTLSGQSTTGTGPVTCAFGAQSAFLEASGAWWPCSHAYGQAGVMAQLRWDR